MIPSRPVVQPKQKAATYRKRNDVAASRQKMQRPATPIWRMEAREMRNATVLKMRHAFIAASCCRVHLRSPRRRSQYVPRYLFCESSEGSCCSSVIENSTATTVDKWRENAADVKMRKSKKTETVLFRRAGAKTWNEISKENVPMTASTQMKEQVTNGAAKNRAERDEMRRKREK